MIDLLRDADAWRLTTAGFSVVVLFVLTAGIVARGDEVPEAWRMVLWAVVAQQAANAYLHVSRATSPGFPDEVDAPLAGVAISCFLLLIAVVGTFVVKRVDDDGP